ncbi:MAG TPA: ethylbenzene dehydrogenase-related protein, partial [Dehalococcoidia bacterium]|nr:ethylbenzene dehydrogenase-related protein [Dehalococcoidia bacterium]
MLNKIRRRPRVLLALLAALSFGALLQFTDTNPAVSQTLALTAYEAPDDPGLDPQSAVWDKVNSIRVPLTAQAGTYAAGGSIATIRAQAVHHGGKVFIRLTWADGTLDDATTKVEDFADGVAVEFPASGTSKIPSLCMGQADAAVNIWHWRADSNAGFQDPNVAYGGSLVDFYPDTSPLFYTAREAGNPYANPELGPVQSLTSKAFGELAALAIQDVSGKGSYTADGWQVVIARNFSTGNPSTVTFSPNAKMDMAFAVWDGSKEERNGRKAVSQFVTLSVASSPAYLKPES